MTVIAAIGWLFIPILFVMWIYAELTDPKNKPMPKCHVTNKLDDMHIEDLHRYLARMEELDEQWERDIWSKTFKDILRRETYVVWDDNE